MHRIFTQNINFIVHEHASNSFISMLKSGCAFYIHNYNYKINVINYNIIYITHVVFPAPRGTHGKHCACEGERAPVLQLPSDGRSQKGPQIERYTWQLHVLFASYLFCAIIPHLCCNHL